MTKKELEKIWQQVPAEYYEKGIRQNPLQEYWHLHKWQKVAALIPGRPKKILDVGCASGWLAAKLAKKYPRAQVWGIDASSKMIVYARRKHPGVHFNTADTHKLPFADDGFDIIVCTEVLEHVVSPLQALKEMKRCLKKGGYLIISLDSGSRLFRLTWFFWTKITGRVWRQAHLHAFNVDRRERLFAQAGLVMTKQEYFNFGMAVAFLLKSKSD